ncbi:hypothetical protein SCP_0200810 [Sparassis crispa]|uniref:Uncharacterized protein n=1 Tax=Sparassis crispa TaxID=139825 RepID=A0A401G9N2_9APHY|nr:hypothetical protein SCP_0200810 [Sparassis crispa]GBE78884.1 hypothetical protein SCP_0200810 [Sparassis crispa]
MPLIIGGYFLTDQQLATLGAKRGLNIPNGEAYILNSHLLSRGIKYCTAIPVALPQKDPHASNPFVTGTLITTHKRDDNVERLRDCVSFVENNDDLQIKEWLQRYGVPDPVFETVPDPFGKFNENGVMQD